MKTRYIVASALLTGIGLGALAVQSLHAQAKPPAYAIAEVTVSNEDGYQKELKAYGPKVGKVLADGGGKYHCGDRTVHGVIPRSLDCTESSGPVPTTPRKCA